MKLSSKYILILLASIALLAPACSNEPLNSQYKNGRWCIPFTAQTGEELTISTRSTLGKVSESNVYNMFVFLFGSDGTKLQTAYYSNENKVNSAAEVQDLTSNAPAWYVYNNSTETITDVTNGYVRIPAPIATGCTLYAIANIDTDMINVSPERLKAENLTLEDLKNFVSTLNQKVTARNGYFPMSGSIGGVSVTSTGFTFENAAETILELSRLDAKIEFNFVIDNSTSSNYTYYDDNGDPYVVDERVKSFTPRTWKVVNIPLSEFVLSYKSRGISDVYGNDAADYLSNLEGTELRDYFFNTGEYTFETITDNGTVAVPNNAGGTFSFYMPENKRTPKAVPANINLRSAQVKFSGTPGLGNDGVYVNDPSDGERSFVYANDYSTYVVVTGLVEMDVQDDKAGQSLNAEVQYIIHLGNFGPSGSVGDYNVERNTNYKYTVTIKGLHALRLEVETSNPGNDYGTYNEEINSGASGEVSVAKEEIAICDSHYTSKTVTFHFNSVNDNLTWYIKTPFCEGEPDPVTGSTVNCQDYKWIHFRLNKKNNDGIFFNNQRRKFINKTWENYERTSENFRNAAQNKEGDGTNGLAGYHNDGLMDIIQMCNYIKLQKRLASDEYGNYVPNTSDFDNGLDLNGDGDFLDAGEEEPKISVTVFVDEYYYDSNPMTGIVSTVLWKSFVNKPDRYAHLLCKSGISRDQESKMTGSAITIQQHAIQSIYNTDESLSSLQTGWGLERTDEFNGIWEYWSSEASSDRKNNDPFNGLSNSLREWELCPTNSYNFRTNQEWGDFMDFEVDNETPQLKDDYKYLRYNCLNRNRDNNGDGIIDRSEIRWYTASLRQLIGIYVGEGLIDPSSRLYNRSYLQQNSTKEEDWMQHVISSNQYGNNSNNPNLIWAEEGISTGAYLSDQEGASTKMSVRCIRNLGMPADHDINEVPQDYVSKTNNADNTFTFSAINIDKEALRYYTSRELDMGNEGSEENRLYSTFQVYSEETSFGTDHNFEDFNEVVTQAIRNGEPNPFCPEGYRLPNQRELAMIAYYLNDDSSTSNLGTAMTRTYWSFGALGSGKISSKYGFSFSGGNITLYSGLTTNQTRCVRDIK